MSDQDGLEYQSDGKSIELADALKPLSGPEWEQWQFGNEDELRGLAYVRYWDREADVVILDEEPRAIAWRAVVVEEDAGPLVPEFVSWFFVGGLQEPIEHLMTLPEPGAPGAPDLRMVAPENLRVPPEWWNSGSRVIRPAAEKRPEVHGGGVRKGEAPRA
ncbi:hypothetical protein [Amycolatopsis minnesotensis]|uniref:Uncharacterized protein n=1 Tax=Amycolatopsis minnesotensis TaxID=337894 RepID=A0ABN2Q011_9PSEU